MKNLNKAYHNILCVYLKKASKHHNTKSVMRYNVLDFPLFLELNLIIFGTNF